MLLPGCGRESGVAGVGMVTVADSASVRIVTTEGRSDAVAPWRISTDPLFRVGWDPEGIEFERISYGFIDDDGAVVVADGAAQKVYAFDRGGELITSLGAPGEGPGEFGSLGRIIPLGGDTILAGDTGNFRITTYTRNGYVGDVRFESYFANAFYEPIAKLPDGTVLLTPTSLRLAGMSPGPDGWFEYPIVSTSDFETFDTLLMMPLFPGSRRGDMNPVRHSATVDIGAGRLVHATTNRPEVTWWAPNGDLLQIARWDAVGQEVTDTDWDDYERGARARNDPDADQERFEKRLRDQRRDFSGALPLFWRGVGDQAGNVWFSTYDIFLGTNSRFSARYLVVGADGEFLGRVDFPRPLYLLDASQSRVAGIELNAFDVQAVAVYSIEKPGG
jgi:hypothetical protein